jgi:RNA polymerase sigma-70 factor (ECF subfamily)
LAELDRAIRAAVDRLPPRCREAFQLSREHQLSYEQIAETMGTSVKTVQEQIGRALRALRSSLAEWLQ